MFRESERGAAAAGAGSQQATFNTPVMGKLIFFLLFAVALVLFASENTTSSTIQFLVWKSQDFSLAMVIMLSAVLGAIIALIATIPCTTGSAASFSKDRELEDLREQVH